MLHDEDNTEKDKNRSNTYGNELTRTPSRSSGVASNLDYRILTNEPAYGRGVASDLECVDFLF